MAALVAEQAQRGGFLFLGWRRVGVVGSAEAEGILSPQGCGGRRTSAARGLFSFSKLSFSPAPSPFFLLLLSHSLFTPPPFLRVLPAGRQSNAV